MKKGTNRTFRVFTERLSGSLFTTLLNSYNPRLPTVCVCVSLFPHLLKSSHRIPAVAHPGSEVGGGWSFVVFIGLVDELRDADQLRHGELRQTQTDRGRKNPVKTAALIAQPQVEQPHLDASRVPAASQPRSSAVPARVAAHSHRRKRRSPTSMFVPQHESPTAPTHSNTLSCFT